MSRLIVTIALVLAACGSETPPPTTTRAAVSSLFAACGAKVVVQTDWFPEPEHGALYQLIGPEAGIIDKDRGRYSGPIGDTGVTLEVRAGGPFLSGQSVVSLLYQDPEILLGFVNTDVQVRNSAKLPTVAVMATLDKSPLMLMWDPARYEFEEFADIGRSGATVLYFEGVNYIDYLVAKGFIRAAQIDGSYKGAPDRFVSEGDIVQQGFVTNEPYKYENDIVQWRKPVKWLLVHDSGFGIYSQALAGRPEVVEQKRDCLELFVPLLQRAQAFYVRNPQAVNDELLRIVKTLDTFWTLSEGGNADAVEKMLELGIVSNGPDATIGNFDRGRVEAVIAALRPVFLAKGVDVKTGLTADDLVTNEFIDGSIGL